MLSMMLLFAVAPQSVILPMPQDPPPSPPKALSRVIGDAASPCRSPLMRVDDPTSPNAGLTWREGGQPVALYRLLDRWVSGCPEPIIVNYRVPGSNALGRELGRDPGPVPSFTPRP